MKPLVYNYRAYGWICIGKHEKALDDLTYIQKFYELETSSEYNKYICEGILLSN